MSRSPKRWSTEPSWWATPARLSYFNLGRPGSHCNDVAALTSEVSV
jgi:hypothetical protein